MDLTRSIKDKKEVAEKLKKFKENTNAKIAKWTENVKETEAEIETVSNRVRERRQEFIDKEARNKFIKDEFTLDGTNVTLEQVEQSFTEKEIDR